MDVKDFINASIDGNAVEAQQALSDVISARAMEALASRKTEIAQNLYNGKKTETAETQEEA
jgi:hypothetical protein